jgi:hypothetical protein
MKTKVSKKEINARFNHVLNVHADEIPNLLYFTSADYYATRSEGWACDFYVITNEIIFSSGDAPTGKQVNRDFERKYNARAKKITQSKTFKLETKRKKIESLLLEFTNELINK